MIKAVATGPNGRKIVVLGIDKGNLKRLKKGMPLVVRLSEMGLPDIEVVVHYRDTLRQVQQDLEPMIGLSTKILYDPRVEEIMDGENETGGANRGDVK